MVLKDILKKSANGEFLSKEELKYLLGLPPQSEESFQVMALARKISDEITGAKAEIHAQLALNLAPCPADCKFCAFASVNNVFQEEIKIDAGDAASSAALFEQQGANAIYIMSTANYDFREFLEVTGEIKGKLKPGTMLIANVGDKTAEQAKQLKEAGYSGIYHAVRLGEGKDTRLNPKKRLESILNFRKAGLEIGTCVEPVGPEHTNEELAEMIMLTNSFSPAFSGAARRITIPGSGLEKHGMISELRMAQIVAVTRLGMDRNVKGNCTHEPCTIGAAAGANLFWAETGANPRDIQQKTEEGRGHTVEDCKLLFNEMEIECKVGASAFFN